LRSGRSSLSSRARCRRVGHIVSPRRSLGFLSAAGVGIVALTLIAVCLHVPGSIWAGTLARKDGVVALMLASAALYGGAVWLVVRVALPRRAVVVVLAVAVILRIVLIASPPFMSSDVYRYVWDGRVQAAGINPYRYIPVEKPLMALRDRAIYENVNRKDYAHTIYPPVAEMFYALMGHISQTVLAMKIGLVVLEFLGVAAMIRLLALAGMPASRVLIYAWNPLAAWAVAGDGHIDGAAIGLVGLSMLAWAMRRDGIAGALLGGAILTKFLPVVVAPALWQRWRWKFPSFCAAVILASYAAYSSVGWHVLGFLPDYTKEEGLRKGSGFWLVSALSHLTPLPSAASSIYLVVVASLLALLAYRLNSRHGALQMPVELGSNMAFLAAGTMAAMSPHYPWYYAWIALPSCLWVWPSAIWLSLYSDPWHDEILISSAVFVPAVILAVRDVAHARHQSRSKSRACPAETESTTAQEPCFTVRPQLHSASSFFSPRQRRAARPGRLL
jgi:alpha-1,6-mannosyltransferase